MRRKVGPVKHNVLCKMSTNQELTNLYGEPVIVSEIRIGKLRWNSWNVDDKPTYATSQKTEDFKMSEHVERMIEEIAVKRVF
jgi:hypothetical protein